MLVHMIVRTADGEILLDRNDNEAQAQRVFNKAMEKSTVFIACHHKVEMPKFIDPKQHDEAVTAARALSESDREDAYAAGYAAMVDKLAEAIGAEIGTDDVACIAMITELAETAKELADQVTALTMPAEPQPAPPPLDMVEAGAEPNPIEPTATAPSKASAKQSKK